MRSPQSTQVAQAIIKPMRGGKRGGKGVLTNIAVPAVLLYANTITKSIGSSTKHKKYSNKNRSRKNRSRKYRK